MKFNRWELQQYVANQMERFNVSNIGDLRQLQNRLEDIENEENEEIMFDKIGCLEAFIASNRI